MGRVVADYTRMLIGRQRERATLQQASTSTGAELVAVYGRRRVGKTFLVREHFGDAIRFELTGLHGAPPRSWAARSC